MKNEIFSNEKHIKEEFEILSQNISCYDKTRKKRFLLQHKITKKLYYFDVVNVNPNDTIISLYSKDRNLDF
jgi:hypothetical protein